MSEVKKYCMKCKTLNDAIADKCMKCGSVFEKKTRPSKADSPNNGSLINSHELERGLVECEFCKSKIKPEVTYCKNCGLKLRG